MLLLSLSRSEDSVADTMIPWHTFGIFVVSFEDIVAVTVRQHQIGLVDHHAPDLIEYDCTFFHLL